ncbi:hypothetical protein BGX33_006669 [Mortierella sp. NVP41]|nr:hypothetical protein BGX33_006669 [Mortierella sp. NVP41]
MLTTTLTMHQETTLSIKTPVLDDHSTISIGLPADNDSFPAWIVVLKRQADALQVSVMGDRRDSTLYRTMSIIPRHAPEKTVKVPMNNRRFQLGYKAKGCFNAESFMVGNNYSFEIVLSTDLDSSWKAPPAPPLYENTGLTDPYSVSKQRQTIAVLLKDICSTDICFIFPDDNLVPNAVLFAHRSVLALHKTFSMRVYQKGRALSLREEKTLKEDQAPGGSWVTHGVGCGIFPHRCTKAVARAVADAQARFDVSAVEIRDFSLAAFCSLLIFLYSGKIALRTVTNQFALSRFPTRSIDRVPIWNDEPIELEATWEELLGISIDYEVPDLQERCRQGVINGITMENAIESVFSESARDPVVKKFAIANISKNLESIFLDDKDPFAPYKSRSDYHAVMTVLLRLKAHNA